MKKNYFIILLSLFIGQFAYSQCTMNLRMYDDYGDGWNGNTMDVTVNGTTVVTAATLVGPCCSTTGPVDVSFTASTGDTVRTVWNGGGSYGYEVGYEIIANDGSVLFSENMSGVGVPAGSTAPSGNSGNNLAVCPSCPAPSAFTATAVSDNSATISWSSVPALGFGIEYGIAGFTLGTGTQITSPVDSIILTSLTANTGYDFYVKALCSLTDSSTVAGPFSFMTICDTAAIPYLQDFASWPPSCIDLAGGSSSWVSFSGAAEAGFWGIPSGDLYLTTEPILVSANARLKFDWSYTFNATYPNDSVVAQVKEGSGAWTTVWGGKGMALDAADGGTNTAPGSYANATIILDSATYTNKVIQVRFIGVSGYGPDFFLDNIIVEAIPNCPEPLMLGAHNITATSADINWTNPAGSSSFRLEYGAPGFTLGMGTSSIETNDTVSLAGLTAFTSYEYYVTSICTPSDSSPWSGPYMFTTLCNDTNAGPWMDDVEGHPTTTSAAAISNCWSATNTGSSYDWNITSGGTPSSATGALAANSGTNFFYTEASGAGIGDTAILNTPSIDLATLTSPFMEFYYHMTGAQMGSLSVELYNGTSWTNVLTLSGAQQATQADPWNQQYVDLSTYSGVIKLRFVAISNGGWEGDISLDDIAVIEEPACFAPTMPMASIIASDSAYASWSAPLFGTPSMYYIEYGTTGFTQGTGMIDSSTTLDLGIGGLMPKTNYDYYVVSYCGGTDSSSWVGPISFYTGHCIPAPTSQDGSGITNVTIGTINNTTGSEPGFYGDYDSLSTDVIQGSPAQAFSVEYSTGYTYGTKIWVDWNDDLVFDATEQVYFGLSASANPTVLSGTFAIPSTAALGPHTMRIGGTDNDAGPTDACYTGSYGSFEDYTLNVIPPCYVSGIDSIVACDSLTWIDGMTYTMDNSTAIDTIKSSVAGICDSIFTLNLTINASSTSTDVHVVCDSMTWIDGITYTASNSTATFVYTNAAGCDSTVHLDLTVNNSISVTDVITVCDSYVRPGGTIANYSNTYFDTIPTSNGCDSMVTTVLTVNYTTNSTTNVTACDSYTSPSGKVWTLSGLNLDTIPNASGCDSLMAFNLTIKSSSAETRTIASCFSYTVPETGSVYTTSGTYTDVTTNAYGCPHTITTVLTINTANAGTINVSGITMSATATGVSYKWVDCDNNYSYLLEDTLQTYTPPRNGNYAVWVTTPEGCSDTSACVSIQSVSLDEYIITESDINIFPNPASDLVTIDILNQNENVEITLFDIKGKLVYSKNVSNKNNKITFDVSELAEGTYTITVFNEFFSTSKKITVVK